MPSPKSEIILPLDFETQEEALQVLDSIGPDLKWVKVGLQMYLNFGPDWVKALADRGYSIFLDLKLHDIPNTVAGAVKSVADLPIKLLTLHTLGGVAMMRAARKARDESGSDLKLIGVTMLTSMDKSEMNTVGIPGEVPAQVLRLGKAAKEAKLDGIVSSPQELVLLKNNIKSGFVFITPGVRPADAAQGDQSRVTTPAEAVKKGSNYLVIGRPIYLAPDPQAAFQKILEEISE